MQDNQIFNMFRPEELQKIIVGATVVDWRGIESGARRFDRQSQKSRRFGGSSSSRAHLLQFTRSACKSVSVRVF